MMRSEGMDLRVIREAGFGRGNADQEPMLKGVRVGPFNFASLHRAA